jgi:hypothetical protein
MPAVRTITRPPLKDSVTVHIPEEYRSYSLEIIVVPVFNEAATRKYDFSDLVGRAKFDGDPVAYQRSVRDEW